MVSGWSIRCALKVEDRNACITEWSLNISIIFYYKHFYYQIKAAHWCWRYIYLLNIPLECVINIVSFNKLQTIYFVSFYCMKYLTSVQYLYSILVMTCWDCNYNYFFLSHELFYHFTLKWVSCNVWLFYICSARLR